LNFAKIFCGFDFPDKGGGFQGVPRETSKVIFVLARIICVKSGYSPSCQQLVKIWAIERAFARSTDQIGQKGPVKHFPWNTDQGDCNKINDLGFYFR